jgi:hypothetical protein
MAAQPKIDLSAGLVPASGGGQQGSVDISAGLTPKQEGPQSTTPQISKGMSDDDIIKAFGYDPATIKKSPLYRDGILRARVDEGSYKGFGKKIAQFIQGVADPAMGGLQLAAHGLAALGAVQPGTKDYIDLLTKINEAEYQQKVRGGDTSTDYTRGAGNVAAAVALPGGAEAGLGRAALTGAGMAVLQPETNTDNYGATKVREAATGAILGPAGSLVGRGASKLVAKAVNASNGVLPSVAQRVADLSERYGVRTTAGDVSGSPVMQKVETQAENVPFIGMGKFRAAQQQDVQGAAANLSDDMRQQLINTPFKGQAQLDKAAAAGDKKALALKQAIASSGDDWNTIIKTSGNVQAFRRKLMADQLYDRVGQLAQGAGDVPLTRTAGAIQSAKAELQKAALSDPQAMKLVNELEENLGSKQYQMMRDTPQGKIGSTDGGRTWEPAQSAKADTSFDGVRQLRSDLGSLISDYYQGKNAVTGSKGVGILQGIRNAIDDDLNSFAKNSGQPGLKQAWLRADTFYKNAVVPYKNTELAKALTDAPADEIFGKFIQAGKGGRAQRFYDALDPKGQSAVRYGVVANALDDATSDAKGIFSPARFASTIRRTAEANGVFFRGDAKAELDGFTKLMDHVTRAGQYAENPPTGQRAIPWIIGALGGNAAMTHPAGAASVWGAAKVAQVMLTSDAGKRFLLAASKVEPGTSAMSRLVDEISSKIPAVAGRIAGEATKSEGTYAEQINQLRQDTKDFQSPGVKNPTTGSAALNRAKIQSLQTLQNLTGRP